MITFARSLARFTIAQDYTNEKKELLLALIETKSCCRRLPSLVSLPHLYSTRRIDGWQEPTSSKIDQLICSRVAGRSGLALRRRENEILLLITRFVSGYSTFFGALSAQSFLRHLALPQHIFMS